MNHFSAIAPAASRTRSLLLICAAVLVYLSVRALVALFSGISDLPAGWLIAQQWLLLFLLPWLVLLPLAGFILNRHSRASGADCPSLPVMAANLFLIALVHTLVATGVLLLVPRLAGSDSGAIALRNAARMMLDEGWLLFDSAIFSALAAAHHSHRMQQRLRAMEDNADRLGRSLADSRLHALKMQLNPHFLFNTLNGLSVLIDKQDNSGARKMLDELSSFLRQTLRSPKARWVSLEKELAFVKQYLSIEQYRFGKRLSYFEECEPLALEARIPPLLLQPLFENAIVHGLADKEGECRLSFECRLYDRYLIMLIFDNGENFDDASDPLMQGGIGLSNIQGRLREVYGGKYSLQIEKKPDGTLVTLKLPSYKDAQF